MTSPDDVTRFPEDDDPESLAGEDVSAELSELGWDDEGES